MIKVNTLKIDIMIFNTAKVHPIKATNRVR